MPPFDLRRLAAPCAAFSGLQLSGRTLTHPDPSGVDALMNAETLVHAAPFLGVLGLLGAFGIYGYVKRQPAGNARMQEIAEQIHLGAMLFLRREYTILAVFIVIVFVILTVAAAGTAGTAAGPVDRAAAAADRQPVASVGCIRRPCWRPACHARRGTSID